VKAHAKVALFSFAVNGFLMTLKYEELHGRLEEIDNAILTG
jgi:hypothetical protein